MSKRIARTAVLVTILAMVLCGAPSAAAAVPESVSAICSEPEWAILTAANKERMAAGLAPLSTFALLQDTAEIRAEEISKLFGHTRPDRTSCFTALDQKGVDYYTAGENIARGTVTDPWAVHGAWMESTGHRDNILHAEYDHLGTGCYADEDAVRYWAQMFTGGCDMTGIAVTVGAVCGLGTAIDDMGGIVTMTCAHGASYMPLIEEMCQGFDSSVSGRQTVTVQACGLTASVVITVKNVENFDDVHPDDPYYAEILSSREKGLIVGIGGNRFEPEGKLNRSMFVTILHRLAGTPQSGAGTPFSDVDAAAAPWYLPAICWAAGSGVVQGYPDGRFGINDMVSREQMALMAYRYYIGQGGPAYAGAVELNGYTDRDKVSDYARPALAWALETGLLETRSGSIAAWNAATRAEAAALFVQLGALLGR